jgi:hypothetical protein
MLNLPPSLTSSATATIGYETNTPDPQSPQADWHDSRPVALSPYESDNKLGHKVAFAMKVGDRAVAFSLKLTDHNAGQPFCGTMPPVTFMPPSPDTLPLSRAEAGAIAPPFPQHQ